jgi:hypothetical protein
VTSPEPPMEAEEQTRTRRRVALAVCLMGLLSCLSCGLLKLALTPPTPETCVAIAEEVSGITWPKGAQVISGQDGGDGWLWAHLRVATKDVEGLVSNHGFSKSAEGPGQGPWGALPSNPDFYEKWGERPNQTWRVYIDRNSGLVWIEVRYPDMAGDPPN